MIAFTPSSPPLNGYEQDARIAVWLKQRSGGVVEAVPALEQKMARDELRSALRTESRRAALVETSRGAEKYQPGPRLWRAVLAHCRAEVERAVGSPFPMSEAEAKARRAELSRRVAYEREARAVLKELRAAVTKAKQYVERYKERGYSAEGEGALIVAAAVNALPNLLPATKLGSDRAGIVDLYQRVNMFAIEGDYFGSKPPELTTRLLACVSLLEGQPLPLKRDKRYTVRDVVRLEEKEIWKVLKRRRPAP